MGTDARAHESNPLGQYVGAAGLRDDLFELMNGLDTAQELEWGRVVSRPSAERAAELGRIGRDHGCRQVVVGERVLWLDDGGRVQAMFCFVERPTEVAPFLDTYRTIEAMDCPLAFLIHPQLGRQDTFDAYRLSRRSYAEHSWELGLKGPAETRPLHPRLRGDLYDLFRLRADEPTKAISEDEACHWAWALYTSREQTVAKLQRESVRHGCTQHDDGRFILWTDGASPQAMFSVIADPTQVTPFREIYENIIEIDCPLTYAFVYQPHEGERWDLHRLSPQFSFLEHNWAFWKRNARPDPAAATP